MVKVRIQILIQHQQNHHLLQQWLMPDYDVISNDILSNQAQILITDREGLEHYNEQIQVLKHEIAPLFLPVLLITNDIHKAAKQSDMWHIVDDLLQSPVDLGLLKYRLNTLTRIRNLSEKNFEQAKLLDEQRLIAEVLQDTAIILTSTLNRDEVFDRILENIDRVIVQKATAIFLIENGYGRIIQSKGYTKATLSAKKLFFDRTPIHMLPNFQAMINTKQTIHLSNLSLMTMPYLPSVQALVISPISLSNDIIGFIIVELEHPEANEVELSARLTVLAAQSAIAIQNASLYARAQDAAVFEERQRLARDFHDSVSQTLFSASVITQAIQRNGDTISDSINSLLDELYLLIRGALAETRTLLLELKPTKLLETDLSDLLKQSAEALWSRKRIQLSIDIEEEDELPLRVKVAFYRIAREALHNIVKHSHAKNVDLYYRGKCDQAILSISDDGIGFAQDSKKTQQGLGLSGMVDRAESIGAEFNIKTSRDSGGTSIHILWNKEVDVIDE